jgi:drug/metabolite transporter (DMT)-like permease
MGILFGLFTALAWGCSDFLARFATRRIGALRTTLYMQFTGLILLTMCLPYVGGWGHLRDGSGWQPWAWGALAGLFNGVSSLALYRSFELGKMAVVAPLSASYPALTVLLLFFSGERLTALRAAGVVLVIAGVICVARGESATAESATSESGSPGSRPVESAFQASQENPNHSRLQPMPNGEVAEQHADALSNGVGWAIVSSLGFGILFWLLGTRVVPAVGFAASVWMIRLTSSVFTAVCLLLLRQPIAPPRNTSVVSLLLGMGALDTAAFVLNNRGMQLDQISVVSVLASLYGAVTVLLAAAFLREHLTKWQWLGIVAIFTGIVAISR